MPGVGQDAWWNPSEDGLDRDEPLTREIELSPYYCNPLNSAVERRLRECRLATHQVPARTPGPARAWQQDFESDHHYDTGWRSAAIGSRWAQDAEDLADDVQAALGSRAELTVRL
jgi:hypothetical protein